MHQSGRDGKNGTLSFFPDGTFIQNESGDKGVYKLLAADFKDD
jgi:hypothetical protein